MENAQREQVRQSWEKFLDPQSLRANLISCSLFIVAWETFSNGVIDYLHGFYHLSHDPNDGPIAQAYQDRVLDRHKSPLTASLLWFLEMGAIDQLDLDLVDRIRQHRNELAHELPKFLCTASANLDTALFQALIDLTAKIGRWWVLEVEVPSNPDFDGQEIDPSGVQSGDMWFLDLLLKVATGDEAESTAFYHQFREVWQAGG